MKANLNPIAFFIWGNFLNPIPLWIYRLGKRMRHDQVTDAPGCCAFSCPVSVSVERETAETTLQWNTADLVLCFFWAQLALIYCWRVIHGVKSKGWMKPLTRVSSALAFTGNQKLKVRKKNVSLSMWAQLTLESCCLRWHLLHSCWLYKIKTLA